MSTPVNFHPAKKRKDLGAIRDRDRKAELRFTPRMICSETCLTQHFVDRTTQVSVKVSKSFFTN